MIWNTIVHPRMMAGQGDGGLGPVPADGPTLPDANESVIEGIKYADPHKLAFFDLLVEVSNEGNPKLIHGDFETVKNKILNHELVIGGVVLYKVADELSGVTIINCANISYNKDSNKIFVTAFPPDGGDSMAWVVSSDNSVSIDKVEITPNPGGDSGGTVVPTPNV